MMYGYADEIYAFALFGYSDSNTSSSTVVSDKDNISRLRMK